jgi:hypothetical protein
LPRILVFGFILLLLAAPAAAQSGPGQVGSVAADWTLTALDGETYRLGDYRDAKVVFFFVVGWG